MRGATEPAAGRVAMQKWQGERFLQQLENNYKDKVVCHPERQDTPLLFFRFPIEATVFKNTNLLLFPNKKEKVCDI